MAMETGIAAVTDAPTGTNSLATHGPAMPFATESAGRLTAEARAALEAGDPAAAHALCLRALARDPDDAFALHVAGMSAFHLGRRDEALTLLQRSIRRQPYVAEFHNNLGVLWGRLGRHDHAAAACARAAELRPDYADAHANLGTARERLGDLEAAEAACRRAAELAPGWARAHFGLGDVLRRRARYNAAIAAYRRALELRPDYPEALGNLSLLHEELGQVGAALDCVRRAAALRPDDARLHGKLLFPLHYDWHLSPRQLYDEHRRWAYRHAAPLRPARPAFSVDRRDPHRRLRVGYASADLRFHVVGRLLLPLLRHHDRRQVEVIGYCDAAEPDHYTDRLRGLADGWRDTRGLSDAAFADLVRRDRVDVLVDCNAHIAHNRLLAFARRAAPVQVTHFGYPNTTGMAGAMDWRLTDAASEPPGGPADALNVERLYRVDPCAWCYLPDDEAPPVATLPAAAAGHVTFGCLNKLVKVSDPCVAVWSAILRAVPNSRLLLLADGGAAEHGHTLGRFAAHGVEAGRLELAGKRPHEQYLRLHDRIDVGLDPFPFNGDNTFCDAMWMGVPSVALAGDAFVSRRGVSHLRAVGLPELIADSSEQYVAKAVALAGDLDRLASLRASLRDRMRSSPLCDAAGFARKVEAAYRHMWAEWCKATEPS